MRKSLFLLFIALSVAGCGDASKQREETSSIDESKDRELTQKEKRELISYFTSKVSDPDSLKFRFPPVTWE